jgi:NaMN:DMB phosphoribosyltransferase
MNRSRAQRTGRVDNLVSNVVDRATDGMPTSEKHAVESLVTSLMDLKKGKKQKSIEKLSSQLTEIMDSLGSSGNDLVQSIVSDMFVGNTAQQQAVKTMLSQARQKQQSPPKSKEKSDNGNKKKNKKKKKKKKQKIEIEEEEEEEEKKIIDVVAEHQEEKSVECVFDLSTGFERRRFGTTDANIVGV